MSAIAAMQPQPQPEASGISREVQARLDAELLAFVQRLTNEAERRVGLKKPIEDRWLKDIRQYHGVHDAEQLQTLRNAKRSTIFINQTRPKTNAMAARIADLLFPTDDRNWGIKPTPVPELAAEAQKAAEDAIRARQAADEAAKQEAPDAANAAAMADVAEAKAEKYRLEMAEATRRSDLMAAEMDDQLTECSYNAMMREVVEDGCKIGSGVVKGPIANGEPRRRWVINGDGSAALQEVPDPAPRFRRTDPWHFFPDPDAKCVSDSEDFFERHLYKKQDLRRLAKMPNFRVDAIRKLLNQNAKGRAPQFLTDLRSITTGQAQIDGDFYVVWEYYGYLTAEDLERIIVAIGDQAMLNDMVPEDMDPLQELGVCIWFCDGELLKIAPHPMDSGEPLYSVFNLEKDDSSLWGYGVPYLMRDSQAALNGAWRMMMDNAALSTGPQIEVNRRVIDPADGVWELTPRKVWIRKTSLTAQDDAYPAIRSYNIDSHQAELAGIIEIAMKFIDDETSLPQIAQGEQGARPTPTLGGMSILMNSANVVFRRIVKNFDDDVTVPNIRRLYHWNMQFSPKGHIKGDYEIDARGSSVLLVREMMAQNLMMIASQFGAHPVYGIMIKHPEIMRRIIQAHMIPADDIVFSKTEIDRMVAASSEEKEDPAVTLREMEINSKVEIANLDRQTRIEVAKLAYATAMTQLAEQRNMTLDELEAKLNIEQMRADSAERKLAVETALTQQIGPTGGGVY